MVRKKSEEKKNLLGKDLRDNKYSVWQTLEIGLNKPTLHDVF